MQVCTNCKNDLLESKFYKDRKAKNGLQSQCIDCRRESSREWQKLHKKYDPVLKERERIRGLRRYRDNKVHYNISRMLRQGLNGVKKSGRTFELLGYSLDELKKHLEIQFKEGMSWENYGEWHIDHITAQSKLPYDSVNNENFKLCWSINNLQPLWAADNIRKSNKDL